jgi:phage-related protein
MLDLRKALLPVEFIGSSKRDVSGFPDPVKQDIGHALFVAQQRRPCAKREDFAGVQRGQRRRDPSRIMMATRTVASTRRN